jgi:hypothetical protein
MLFIKFSRINTINNSTAKNGRAMDIKGIETFFNQFFIKETGKINI